MVNCYSIYLRSIAVVLIKIDTPIDTQEQNKGYSETRALSEGGLEGLRNLSLSAGVVGVIALDILSQMEEQGLGSQAYDEA